MNPIGRADLFTCYLNSQVFALLTYVSRTTGLLFSRVHKSMIIIMIIITFCKCRQTPRMTVTGGQPHIYNLCQTSICKSFRMYTYINSFTKRVQKKRQEIDPIKTQKRGNTRCRTGLWEQWLSRHETRKALSIPRSFPSALTLD